MRHRQYTIRKKNFLTACTVILSLICITGNAAYANNYQKAPLFSVSPASVRSYPHDNKAFTQGLFFIGDTLYESTGGYNTSYLRQTELHTGKVLRETSLADNFFGEGAAWAQGRIIWLTWHAGQARAFSPATLQQTHSYFYQGEGWGLTASAEHFIMSNGSDTLFFRNQQTFAPVKTIQVHDAGTPVNRLNELEWVKGYILANIWLTDQIAQIDPQTGRVVCWYDISALRPASARKDKQAVANGIAYNPLSDNLFITGKRWPVLYELPASLLQEYLHNKKPLVHTVEQPVKKGFSTGR